MLWTSPHPTWANRCRRKANLLSALCDWSYREAVPHILPFLKIEFLSFRLGLDGVAGGELAFQDRETKRIQ
jgi:hypothetical protein